MYGDDDEMLDGAKGQSSRMDFIFFQAFHSNECEWILICTFWNRFLIGFF